MIIVTLIKKNKKKQKLFGCENYYEDRVYEIIYFKMSAIFVVMNVRRGKSRLIKYDS
jgi:hypothetical protein